MFVLRSVLVEEPGNETTHTFRVTVMQNIRPVYSNFWNEGYGVKHGTTEQLLCITS